MGVVNAYIIVYLYYRLKLLCFLFPILFIELIEFDYLNKL